MVMRSGIAMVTAINLDDLNARMCVCSVKGFMLRYDRRKKKTYGYQKKKPPTTNPKLC